jgi:very-short-patch-repair endonuclease
MAGLIAGARPIDALRDRYLAMHGVRTLRVKAWRVERRLHEVLAALRDAAKCPLAIGPHGRKFT